jgi:hypothetical protein
VIRRVQDLVVEDRVIEGKTKTDRVSGLEGLSFVGGNFVGFLSELNNIFALISSGEFSEITEVITLHLHEEHSGLRVLGVRDKRII